MNGAGDRDGRDARAGNRGAERGVGDMMELRAIEPAEPVDPGHIDALWRGVERGVARRSWRTRLLEMSTAARVGLVLAIASSVAALGALAFGIRSGMPAMRVVLVLGALGLCAAACFAVSLRGLDRRPLGRWAWVVVAAALVLPFVLAVVPAGAGELVADGPDAPCLLVGLALGLLVSVPVFLAQRGSVPVWARAAAALAGGGAVGYAVLELHCPSRDVTHLLVGHALVGVVLVIAALAGVAVARR